MDGSGRDPGLPNISVLWRREIPGPMCNMEDTFVERQPVLHSCFKLRERRRGFRVYLTLLSLWHKFASLDSVISTPGDQQTKLFGERPVLK